MSTVIDYTYADIADRTSTEIPDHLEAAAQVPLAVNGYGSQGDVLIVPATELRISFHETAQLNELSAPDGMKSIAGPGINVVEGDVGRNRHILTCAPGGGAKFKEMSVLDQLDFGLLYVPKGETAELVHTGEHGTIAFPAGFYRVTGQADMQRNARVAD